MCEYLCPVCPSFLSDGMEGRETRGVKEAEILFQTSSVQLPLHLPRYKSNEPMRRTLVFFSGGGGTISTDITGDVSLCSVVVTEDMHLFHFISQTLPLHSFTILLPYSVES